MISIVIPVHNKEKYMDKTISSVLSQTYANYELLLIDDGSDDGSSQLCDIYAAKDCRIRVFHQKNAGVSVARNKGVVESRYELIAFLDADDFWHERYLEEMVLLINKFPEVSIYSSQFSQVVNGKICMPEILIKSGYKYLTFDLIKISSNKARFPINTSSVVIRKNAIVNVGFFDERIYMFEDYDLFLRIAITSSVAFINSEPLSFYNLDVPSESKARGKVPLFEKNWIYYMDKFNPYLKNNHDLRKLLVIAKLKQIIFYRHYSIYRKQVEELESTLDKKYVPAKYKIMLFFSTTVSDFILNMYLKMKKIYSIKK